MRRGDKFSINTMKTKIAIIALAALLSSCSGLYSGITGQPVPATPVAREGGSPVNVATSDLLQAEVGPKEVVYGLYDTGVVARAVGKVSNSGK